MQNYKLKCTKVTKYLIGYYRIEAFLERTKQLRFLTLLNNIAPVALFNYSNL
jgi:hypothetical protein